MILAARSAKEHLNKNGLDKIKVLSKKVNLIISISRKTGSMN